MYRGQQLLANEKVAVKIMNKKSLGVSFNFFSPTLTQSLSPCLFSTKKMLVVHSETTIICIIEFILVLIAIANSHTLTQPRLHGYGFRDVSSANSW